MARLSRAMLVCYGFVGWMGGRTAPSADQVPDYLWKDAGKQY